MPFQSPDLIISVHAANTISRLNRDTGLDSLVLNLRMYGTMLSRSNTSARGVSPSSVSAKTATGFRNGCSESAHESLRPHSQPLFTFQHDADGQNQTYKGRRRISDLPNSCRLPVLDAVWLPEACSECVTYILSELCPILAR